MLGVEPDRGCPTCPTTCGASCHPDALGRAISSATTRPAPSAGSTSGSSSTPSSLTGDHPAVVLQIRHAHVAATTVPAGTLTAGLHTYTAAVDCTDGCSFAGLIIDRSIDAQDLVQADLRLLVGAGRRRRRLPAVVDGAGGSGVLAPRASSATARTPPCRRSGAALGVSFRATDGSSPILQFADSPTVLPVVASPKSLATPASTGAIQDYSGTVLPYRVVQMTTPLPVVLDTGAIADLDYLRLRLPNFDREASWSVWLGPSAPADATSRLQKAGLLVQNTTTTSSRVAALGRQGPALGLLLLLVCAVAAAVLAVGGTAVSLLADARRRLFELAALRVIGVRRRTLRDSAMAEQALLLGAALVLGLPSGFAAAALVLPVVPEFSDPTPTVLRFQPPVLVALGCALAFAILLGITAVVAGRVLVRAAVPSRLRESVR